MTAVFFTGSSIYTELSMIETFIMLIGCLSRQCIISSKYADLNAHYIHAVRYVDGTTRVAEAVQPLPISLRWLANVLVRFLIIAYRLLEDSSHMQGR